MHAKSGNRQTPVLSVATGVRPGNHTSTVRTTKDRNVPILDIAVAEYSKKHSFQDVICFDFISLY